MKDFSEDFWEQMREIIEQAHMAGQHVADPNIGNASYSDAVFYAQYVLGLNKANGTVKKGGTMNLEKFTTEELAEEIERRGKVNAVPTFREDVSADDFYHYLGNLAQSVVLAISENGCYNDDLQEYMFKYVMELFYGKDFFKWHNSVVR